MMGLGEVLESGEYSGPTAPSRGGAQEVSLFSFSLAASKRVKGSAKISVDVLVLDVEEGLPEY